MPKKKKENNGLEVISEVLVESEPADLPQRRTPRQGRSQETVDKILGATSRLLAEGANISSLNTNRIAGAAGVSVGGLYRFFSDKQAIVDAIAVQHLQIFQADLARTVDHEKPSTGQDFLELVIDTFVAYLEKNPEFFQIAYGGSHISADVREAKSRPDDGTSGFMKTFLVDALGKTPSKSLDLKLRIAAEVGDRLIAHAFDQKSVSRRNDVIGELKKLLSDYLFDENGAL